MSRLKSREGEPLRCVERIRGSSRRSHWIRFGPSSSWKACRSAWGQFSPMWTDGQSSTRPYDVSVDKTKMKQEFRDCSCELTIFGLNGGWTSRFSIFSQSIRRKKVWFRTSSSPVELQPKRFCGFLVRNWANKTVIITLINKPLVTHPFTDIFCLFAQALRIWNVMIGDSSKQLLLVFTVEWRLPDQHFIKQNTVRPPINRFTVRLIQNDLRLIWKQS